MTAARRIRGTTSHAPLGLLASRGFDKEPRDAGVPWWKPEGVEHKAYLRYCVDRAPMGLALEFGVFMARTIRTMAQHAPGRAFVGFDSFRGLPEKWENGPGGDWAQGYFDLGGKAPRVPEPNVSFRTGLFDETLPEFLAQTNEPVALCHIDCDLYSSTKTVLSLLAPRFKPGTIVLFDELWGFDGWEQHEFRAFEECVAEHQLSFEYLAHVRDSFKAAVRITAVGRARS